MIGVLDTGINPENPSFADVGGDGHDHTNPRGKFFGVCDPAHPDYDPSFACNDKLIGAYDFTPMYPDPENTETPLDIVLVRDTILRYNQNSNTMLKKTARKINSFIS